MFSLCGLRGLSGNVESLGDVSSVQKICVKILVFIYSRTQTCEFAFSHKPLLSPFSFLELTPKLVTFQEPPGSSEVLPGFFIPVV